ncbi:hypothetical protein WICPIJ_006515 [Wickerhamomyces pijperi]|uniref:CMP/dCMP-type deaminase domain-containing protein n=1 Tax=Wickerhamomyces pijperi TaxID=599730 RepID=A0A9P8Q442_WICPI|nr:hypothetical protein WICPIJ_006515 [Wickerhamomyces pijperi]
MWSTVHNPSVPSYEMVKKINNKLQIDYQKGLIESRLLQIISTDPKINILNLIPVWVIEINPKDSSKALNGVKSVTEDPVNLQHVKRVKKEAGKNTLTVLVCSKTYLSTEEEVIQMLSSLNVPDYTNLRTVEVPDHGPNIKELSNQWTREHWPLIWKGNVNDQILNDTVINMDFIYSHLKKISEKSLEIEMETQKEKDNTALPIVTLIAKGPEIVAMESDKRSPTDPLTHSIMSCIDQITSTQKLNNTDTSHQYLLQGYDVYTTHEPCTMCCMALIHSRINRLIYLKQSCDTGSLRSRYFIHDNKYLNSKYEVWEWVGSEDEQISNHSLQNNGLLDILLPKVCNVRLCDVEQFGDNSGDTTEEIRPSCALQLFREAMHSDKGTGLLGDVQWDA